MRRSALWTAAASLLAFAGAAQAQGLPDTLNMTCAQAQAMVKQSGAVVLATGPHLYERYVTGRNFCNPEQEARPAWVRSADNPQCYVYNRCVEVDYNVR